MEEGVGGMSMGSGDLSIGVATLRRLLPLWLRSDGFEVIDEVEIECDGAMLAVDICAGGRGKVALEKYIGSMLGRLTIVDGGVWYAYNKTAGVVYIKVARDDG